MHCTLLHVVDKRSCREPRISAACLRVVKRLRHTSPQHLPGHMSALKKCSRHKQDELHSQVNLVGFKLYGLALKTSAKSTKIKVKLCRTGL